MSFSFPQKCCRCGVREATQFQDTKVSYSSYSFILIYLTSKVTSYRLKLPVCQHCKNKLQIIKNRIIVFEVMTILLGMAAAYALILSPKDHLIASILGGGFGGFIIANIIIKVFNKYYGVVTLTPDEELRFRNSEYQYEFDNLNYGKNYRRNW